MADTTARITISAQDLASEVFARVQQTLGDMGATATAQAEPLSAPFKAMVAAAEESAASLSGRRLSAAWDDVTATTYNAVADMGEGVKGFSEAITEFLENPMESGSSVTTPLISRPGDCMGVVATALGRSYQSCNTRC
jgi:hypothetical protein